MNEDVQSGGIYALIDVNGEGGHGGEDSWPPSIALVGAIYDDGDCYMTLFDRIKDAIEGDIEKGESGVFPMANTLFVPVPVERIGCQYRFAAWNSVIGINNFPLSEGNMLHGETVTLVSIDVAWARAVPTDKVKFYGTVVSADGTRRSSSTIDIDLQLLPIGEATTPAADKIPVADKATLKFDDGKPRFDLLPPRAMLEVAKVCADGASGPYRDPDAPWRSTINRGIRYGRLFAAAERHLNAWRTGHDVDESGRAALAHAAWNILWLLEFGLTGGFERFDDREGIDSAVVQD